MKRADVKVGAEVIYRKSSTYSRWVKAAIVLDDGYWYYDRKSKSSVRLPDGQKEYEDEYGYPTRAFKVACAVFNPNMNSWEPMLANPQVLQPMTETFRKRVQEETNRQEKYRLKQEADAKARRDFETTMRSFGYKMVEGENYDWNGNESICIDVENFLYMVKKR